MAGLTDVSPVSVVVCDDVPEMRAVLQDVLSEDQALRVVGETDNGQTCVELIADLQPDVLLLDLSMPGMGGLEVISHIMSVAPHTAIVVFSGLGAGGMQDLALALGADLYIEKGTPLDELCTAVREVAFRRSQDRRHNS
jgi:DNA-binding NarL/FixJ family response regulator